MQEDLDKEATWEEFEKAHDSLPNNKASGVDGVPSEMLRNGSMQLKRKLFSLCLTMWEMERMPEDFKVAELVN